MNVFKLLFIWLYRHFKTLLVFILILGAGNLLWNTLQAEFKAFSVDQPTKARLELATSGITLYIEAQVLETTNRLALLSTESAAALETRISKKDAEIQQKKAEQRSPLNKAKALVGGEGVADVLRADFELALLEQERKYLQSLHKIASDKISVLDGRVELEKLRLAHIDAYQSYENCGLRLEAMKNSLLTKFGPNFFYPEYWGHRKMQKECQDLLARNQQAHEDFKRLEGFLESIKIPEKIAAFQMPPEEIARVMQPVKERIGAIEESLQNSWFNKLAEPFGNVIKPAIYLLLAYILTPIGVKAFLYYLVAPMVSRCPPVCLLPDQSGAIVHAGDETTRAKISDVSQAVSVAADHELLVHQEYLQSVSTKGKIDTKWLLSGTYLWSSLLSGMVALTRIRTTSEESFVISATKDPLNEVGIIELPDGAAVVMQPHNLIGVVQRADSPIIITQHWQLNKLHAWMTFQLRYLVFHGPGKLIVKGCRGIRVERAGSGRSINQAAMIGFSANLSYSTNRCEPFAAYLMGKQELFNDHFADGPGYYFYEEMPYLGKKTGIHGRGLEGLIEGFLKVFGI